MSKGLKVILSHFTEGKTEAQSPKNAVGKGSACWVGVGGSVVNTLLFWDIDHVSIDQKPA